MSFLTGGAISGLAGLGLFGGKKKDGGGDAPPPAPTPTPEAMVPKTEAIAQREQAMGQRAAAAGAMRSENEADLLGYTPAKRRSAARTILG